MMWGLIRKWHSTVLVVRLVVWAPMFAAVAQAAGGTFKEVTYVANVENGTVPKVRYSGREWTTNEAGYLSGRGPGHQIMMVPPPAEGDFLVQTEFTLPSKGKKSALTLGYDSRIVFTAGVNEVTLEGRFFRAGEKAIEIKTPKPPEGSLVLERKGDRLEIKLDDKNIYTGPCDPGALAMLGFDPMEGIVQLGAFSAQAHVHETEEKEFGNPFGMQLRQPPASAREVFAPVITEAGPTNECALVARKDGTLELYHATKPSSDSISVMRSKDGGLTWSPSEVAFPIPGKIYYAVMATEERDGEVSLVFHVAGEGTGGYRGRLYNVYYTRSKGDGWEAPKLVIPGYVGSIRGLIELQSGRLLLSVGLANPDRVEAPAAGTDYGWNDVVTYFSDDKGRSWKASQDILKLPLAGQNNTRYGAIEPALVQLEDGKVWMLIRSRDGRFWQSFSPDGASWSPPERTNFITSDSPATFVKLRDKRIVLLANACQNWSNPRSYAMGGREVLQAAISPDDGRSWQGFRDVLHETLGPAGGDRGTSYASAVETADGKVCFFGGQGEGKRAIVLFDPNWLTEAEVKDELRAGPESWVQYGDDKLRVEDLQGRDVVSIPLKSSGLCGASWNFPAMKAGEMRFRLWVPKEARTLTLSLNDHFSRVDDAKASQNSIFPLPLKPDLPVVPDSWNDVVLRWDASQAQVLLDGKPVQTFPATKASAYGLNYLRLEARSDSDQGEMKVADLSVAKK